MSDIGWVTLDRLAEETNYEAVMEYARRLWRRTAQCKMHEYGHYQWRTGDIRFNADMSSYRVCNNQADKFREVYRRHLR